MYLDAPYRKPERHIALKAKNQADKTAREVVYEAYCDCLDFFTDKWALNTRATTMHALPPMFGAGGLRRQWLGKYFLFV